MNEDAFYLKMLVVLLVVIFTYRYLCILQKRKEADAELQYQLTLKAIELRNRTYMEDL